MQILKQFVLALTAKELYGSHSQNQQAPKIPSQIPKSAPAVVLWHGLGDRYNSDGLIATENLLKRKLPGAFVHSIYLDENPSLDKRASMLGDANRQVEIVCDQLATIPELARGFDAIGFSQGGLLLRALVERCPNVTVSTLITFGSPHMGVSDLPLCEDDGDWSCRRRNLILKQQVWRDSVQKTVIPAQYFRDMDHYPEYLAHSNFLAAVNNERREELAEMQRTRFEALSNLVLVSFQRDHTLVPKESAFFQHRVSQNGPLVPFNATDFYTQNKLGLKTLHESGKIFFHTIDKEHMDIPEDFMEALVDTYLSPGARVSVPHQISRRCTEPASCQHV